jgi:hypothetical protein
MDVQTETIIATQKTLCFTENRMSARFIGRQPNLINNNLLRETSFNNNSVSVSPLRDLSQDSVQERRH